MVTLIARASQGNSIQFYYKLHLQSSFSPVVPIIPVVIPMAVDLSDAVSRDLIVRRPTTEVQGL